MSGNSTGLIAQSEKEDRLEAFDLKIFKLNLLFCQHAGPVSPHLCAVDSSESPELIRLRRPHNLIPTKHSARGGHWVSVSAIGGHTASLAPQQGEDGGHGGFLKK